MVPPRLAYHEIVKRRLLLTASFCFMTTVTLNICADGSV